MMEQCVLGDVVSLQYGKLPPKEDGSGGEYPIFTGYRISGYAKSYLFRDPEVIVVARGVGGTGDVKISPPFSYVTNLSIVLQPTRPLNKRFLRDYLSLANLRQLDSGAAQSMITIESLRRFPVQLPDLNTQNRIAEILGRYEDLIENNQRRIALLEESARLLYREWFVNLRYPGYESVSVKDGIPDGWELATVDSFGRVETGKTPPTSNAAYFDGDIPFIKTPDMHGRIIVGSSEQNLSESGSSFLKGKLLPVGSLLVSCIGTVGVVSITGKQSHTNQQINAVIPTKPFYRAYLYFALSGLKEYMLGLGGGSTMSNISKSKFSGIPIIKPQDSILEDFEKLLSPLLSQIENLSEVSTRLAMARDVLLPKLMSGEIQV